MNENIVNWARVEAIHAIINVEVDEIIQAMEEHDPESNFYFNEIMKIMPNHSHRKREELLNFAAALKQILHDTMNEIADRAYVDSVPNHEAIIGYMLSKGDKKRLPDYGNRK